MGLLPLAKTLFFLYNDYMNSLLRCRHPVVIVVCGLLLACTFSCNRNTVSHLPKPAAPIMPLPAHVAAHIPVLPKKPVVLPPISFPQLDAGGISSLQFSPNGRRLVLGYGGDSEVTVWNLETGRLAWQRHVDGANGGPVIMDPKGHFLVVETGDMDRGLSFLACTTEGSLLRNLPGYAGDMRADEWSNNAFAWLQKPGRRLVMQGTIDHLQPNGSHVYRKQRDFYDTKTWQHLSHQILNSKAPLPSASSGQIIYGELQSEPSHYISVQGFPRGKWWKGELPSSSSGVYTASLGKYYASIKGNGYTKGSVEVWDLQKKKRLWFTALKNASARSVAIAPNGKLLAVSTLQGQMSLWQLKTGHLITHKQCSAYLIGSMAFSRNSRVLAAGYGTYQQGGGVMLFDCKANKMRAVLSAAFPNNGNYEKDWTLDHPDWFAALPDLSYIASDSVVKKIRTPGKPRDAATIRHFNRPRRVRAALRLCYAQ